MTKETKWSIDQSHSEITFKVKHLMIAHVKGTFKTFDASIYTTANDFTTAVIDFWIDASSISTGDEKRDEHLKGADFFDVQNHKQITFMSSTMDKPDSEGEQELWGDLTMKGITKRVKIDVQFGGVVNDPWGNERAGFSLTAKINRSDWGLRWNAMIETGGIMVSEEVTISCDFELTKTLPKEFKMELKAEAENKVAL
jgi:polyisoprenoid-binding protein YceI